MFNTFILHIIVYLYGIQVLKVSWCFYFVKAIQIIAQFYKYHEIHVEGFIFKHYTRLDVLKIPSSMFALNNRRTRKTEEKTLKKFTFDRSSKHRRRYLKKGYLQSWEERKRKRKKNVFRIRVTSDVASSPEATHLKRKRKSVQKKKPKTWQVQETWKVFKRKEESFPRNEKMMSFLFQSWLFREKYFVLKAVTSFRGYFAFLRNC